MSGSTNTAAASQSELADGLSMISNDRMWITVLIVVMIVFVIMFLARMIWNMRARLELAESRIQRCVTMRDVSSYVQRIVNDSQPGEQEQAQTNSDTQPHQNEDEDENQVYNQQQNHEDESDQEQHAYDEEEPRQIDDEEDDGEQEN